MAPPFVEPPPKPRRDWLRYLRYRLRSPAFYPFLLAVLRNTLSGIGALCLLGLIGVYWQGRAVTSEFEPRFMDTAVKFTRQSLREDVVSALAIRLPVKAGMKVDQVASAMQARARQLGIRQVGRYQLSRYLPADKTRTPRYMEVFEFCDPQVAAALATYNPSFLVHIPCRIALHEDTAGGLWLVAMNLDILIHGSKRMPEEVRAQVLRIQDGLLKIMAAGAEG